MRPPRSRAAFTLAAFLVGRAGLALVVLLARAWLPERDPNPQKDFVAFPSHPFWDSLVRWDSGWYDRVARLGYATSGRGQSDLAFFPAFPYLSRWLGPLLGGHFAAGLVVGNVAFLGGLYLLHALAELRAGEDAAKRSVWLVLLYPATLFYSAYYTEGLFLLAAAGAFYFYERDRLALAGLFGALAAMTRPVGILLFPGMLLGALRREAPLRALWLLLIPAGLAGVMLALERQVGDPLAFVRVQAGWGRVASVAGILRFDPTEVMDWLDVTATLGLLVVAAVASVKLGVAHGVFALGCVAAGLASGSTQSMERYAASVPAVFLLLAMATCARRAERAVMLLFAGLLGVQTALFVGWYWAG